MNRWQTAMAVTWMHKREVRGAQVNVARQVGEVWRVTPNQPLRELRKRPD